MSPPPELVVLIDVDNTLLDNDRVILDLGDHLVREFGAQQAQRYWAAFEQLRTELGYADYLGALQRYRAREAEDVMNNPQLLQMSTFLIDYPFAERLYPGALAVLDRLGGLAQTVIVTDGDVVFQPRKVQRSGLWQAVGGRVLIYVHKELMLDAIQRRYAAQHYVMVDDKLRILAAMKAVLGERLTTVFVRQGHYALDPRQTADHPPADLAIDRIDQLVDLDPDSLRGAPRSAPPSKENT